VSSPATKKPLKPGDRVNPSPGFLVRLAALLYDLLLLIAIFFVATAILLPLNSGEAATPSQLIYYRIYLVCISFAFYGWFWTHGGQTLGLKAWKIKVLTLDEKPISWKQAAYRFLAAAFSWGIFGMGFVWILFDKNKLSWHDRLSKTALFFDNSKPQ
jgi:uncharacterized RDD family membrane protein YckC